MDFVGLMESESVILQAWLKKTKQTSGHTISVIVGFKWVCVLRTAYLLPFIILLF